MKSLFGHLKIALTIKHNERLRFNVIREILLFCVMPYDHYSIIRCCYKINLDAYQITLLATQECRIIPMLRSLRETGS